MKLTTCAPVNKSVSKDSVPSTVTIFMHHGMAPAARARERV